MQAEALLAQARAAASAERTSWAPEGAPPDRADCADCADEEAAPSGFDVLDLIEAMSAHFHEHHQEIVGPYGWSWKLFCAKWVRLIAAAEREEAERAKRTQDRELEEMKATQRALMARAGMAEAGAGAGYGG